MPPFHLFLASQATDSYSKMSFTSHFIEKLETPDLVICVSNVAVNSWRKKIISWTSTGTTWWVQDHLVQWMENQRKIQIEQMRKKGQGRGKCYNPLHYPPAVCLYIHLWAYQFFLTSQDLVRSDSFICALVRNKIILKNNSFQHKSLEYYCLEYKFFHTNIDIWYSFMFQIIFFMCVNTLNVHFI